MAGTVKINAPCQWCGAHHYGTCPLVHAIEYHPNGHIKRVEFRPQEARPITTIKVEDVITAVANDIHRNGPVASAINKTFSGKPPISDTFPPVPPRGI